MEQVGLPVEPRIKGTDADLHHLRDHGFIPGILYGGGKGNQTIQIEQKTFLKQLKEHGKSGFFALTMGNDTFPVKINEIQINPIDRQVVHVDLQRIDLDRPVEMLVPIHFFGQSIGERNGGVIQQQLREIKVRALPASIPEFIQVNIADLDIGDSLYVKDLMLPEDVEVLHDKDSVILKVVPSRMDQEAHLEEPTKEPEVVNARDSHGIDAAK
ncbi:50S ribosomal protein L25 [Tepidibacillus sp. LV47]|uniref:50S ribosomal protein L25 n=1 Tax=Tepidibacillus sp. LV47 TaxID=3398228 RepID=UPI003AAF0D85